MPYIIEGMKQLLATAENLPTLPTVVFQLHRVLENQQASPAEISAIIERDPALTARMLRAANTGARARDGEPVGSVYAAVARLGVDRVRAACMVLDVVRGLDPPASGLDHPAFWTHSAAVGMTVRCIWEELAQEPGISGADAYVAGLLHDVGLLVLEQNFSRDFVETCRIRASEKCRLWQVEEDLLGMDHGAVGGLLLGRWVLPTFIVDAVTNHHHPHQSPAQFQRLSLTVQAAEVLCTEGGAGLAEEGPADWSPAEVLDQLGASREQVSRLQAAIPSIGRRAQQFLS